MMKKTIFAAGAAVLAMGTVAYAAPGMMSEKGPVTLAEAQTKSAAMFDKMDVNSDGQINAADREARMEQRFAKLDTDGNGSLSLAEYTAAHEMRGKRGDGEGKGMRGHHGKRGHGMRMMGKMADTNNDGTITRAEFDAGVQAHFAKMDANGDGTVTVEERQAAREQMREARQERREARQAN
ncbi:EF-hand domain-containing protein [Croceicoccus gelatinilyticus]|uniref:EF-hand domain-containing protein n=1 Tax=Croceicoccus gelatinilyticus TaxID=2835536 RepID=UPI001CECD0C3|nr:EF-hand domain-containing protein [Croceicoccus gelatinilyticus]